MPLRMHLNRNSLRDVIGDTLATERQLSPDAWYVRTDAGAELVVKRVPRQERSRWNPGKPWAELVALDLLAAEGAAVPPLVAADLNMGYLVLQFVPGQSLRFLSPEPEVNIVSSLARALRDIEVILEKEETVLRPYIVTLHDREREQLIQGVGQALDEKARKAWSSLVEEGFGAVDALPTLGSLDVQPDNALLSDSGVTLLDFATVGRQVREHRLIGYMHRAHPDPGTLLGDNGFELYASAFGAAAAIRLALYDFVFTLKVMETVMTPGPKHQPDHIKKAVALWKRPRLNDSRIDHVRRAIPLSEGV